MNNKIMLLFITVVGISSVVYAEDGTNDVSTTKENTNQNLTTNVVKTEEQTSVTSTTNNDQNPVKPAPSVKPASKTYGTKFAELVKTCGNGIFNWVPRFPVTFANIFGYGKEMAIWKQVGISIAFWGAAAAGAKKAYDLYQEKKKKNEQQGELDKLYEMVDSQYDEKN
jgi:hypothetical protein